MRYALLHHVFSSWLLSKLAWMIPEIKSLQDVAQSIVYSGAESHNYGVQFVHNIISDWNMSLDVASTEAMRFKNVPKAYHTVVAFCSCKISKIASGALL